MKEEKNMAKRIQSEIPRIIPQPQEILMKTGSAVFSKDVALWFGKSNEREV